MIIFCGIAWYRHIPIGSDCDNVSSVKMKKKPNNKGCIAAKPANTPMVEQAP